MQGDNFGVPEWDREEERGDFLPSRQVDASRRLCRVAAPFSIFPALPGPQVRTPRSGPTVALVYCIKFFQLATGHGRAAHTYLAALEPVVPALPALPAHSGGHDLG